MSANKRCRKVQHGIRCRSFATKGSSRCFLHQPDRADLARAKALAVRAEKHKDAEVGRALLDRLLTS